MRINQYLALTTSLSRRSADEAIISGKVLINGLVAEIGQEVSSTDTVSYNNRVLSVNDIKMTTILVHKPTGYVCSKNGQGSKTIYDLIPTDLHNLNPIGRLDKDSSGLLIMTNDGALAHKLSHPSFQKNKVYETTLDKPLQDKDLISLKKGISLEDGESKFDSISRISGTKYRITIHEGRNRQIRRTFEKIGYKVVSLHRVSFGPYQIRKLKPGSYQSI